VRSFSGSGVGFAAMAKRNIACLARVQGFFHGKKIKFLGGILALTWRGSNSRFTPRLGQLPRLRGGFPCGHVVRAATALCCAAARRAAPFAEGGGGLG
jgi:hypothetical protein